VKIRCDRLSFRTSGTPGSDERVELDRFAEPLECVPTKGGDRRCRIELLADGVGKNELSALRDRGGACGEVDGGAVVVAFAVQDRSDVRADS
jgi:hypothetical protein